MAGQTQPSGLWDAKIAEIQETIDNLADWAFRDTPNPLNPLFDNVFVNPDTGHSATIRVGMSGSSMIRYMLGPLIDLGEIGETYSLTFHAGEVLASNNVRYPCLLLLDEDLDAYSYWGSTSLPRTVSGTVSASMKYARLVFPASSLLDVYVKRGDTILFSGADINTSKIGKKEGIFTSPSISSLWKPNANGDFIGWNFGSTDTAQTGQQLVYDYPMYKKCGADATALSYSISKVVELPSNTTINLEFSCGVVNSNLMLRLLNPSAKTANYYSANANPRTVNINTATWTHVQLYFLTANYASCYIKDATNNEMLWKGGTN